MPADQYDQLSQRARQALTEGNPTLGRQFYLKALAERPDSPDAHYGLATAFFVLNDLESAAFHFKEVTRIDPLRAGAYVNLGAVYNRLDRLDEAIKALRRGIQLDARRAEAYYNLGLAYRRQGQAELAVQSYREATHHNPRMGDAHYNLANLLLELSRYNQAIVHYKQALEVHPNFEKARLGMEQAEAALRQSENATDQHKPMKAAAGGASTISTDHHSALDLDRTVDPQADGQILDSLHRATIISENYGRDFLKILESAVEPAIKELSTVLLYPEKTGGELSDRLQKFESAVNDLRGMHRNLQLSMKKLREVSDRLFIETDQGEAAAS